MKLALALLALCALSGQQAQPEQQPAPELPNLQTAGRNAARCPVCKQPVDSIAPVTLLVAGDRDSIATLSLPVMVCPHDGVIFAVRP